MAISPCGSMANQIERGRDEGADFEKCQVWSKRYLDRARFLRWGADIQSESDAMRTANCSVCSVCNSPNDY